MRKIIILALAAFMFTACANKNKGYVDRAVKNLEASLDYPKQLKIIATSKADSAFGNNYFTRDEMRGMLKVTGKVTDILKAKTNNLSDESKIDAYTANLMQRQMNAISDIQAMVYRNTPKGQWSGWKVKIDYECVDKNSVKYRAERWVLLDKKGEEVVKTFEIPLP